MAEINIVELIKIIKDDPNYINKWEKEVPVDQSLYIKFHDKLDVNNLKSKIFKLINGNELVIDLDDNGNVLGIEII